MESCNAHIKFTHAFFPVGANNNALPESIRVEIEGSPPLIWREEFVLPAKELSAKSLKGKCPFLRFSASNTTVDNQLFQELQVGLQIGTVLRGYSLHESGAIFFPDGSLRFLRGGELIPERGVGSYVCAPEISEIELARRAEPGSVNALITCLFTLPPQALLTIAYAILTSVRSLVLDAGISLQAVLYIVGCQGMGKTTLATRIASLYRSTSTGKPAAVIQAGSSISATEELLVRHRDQPVIVDDLCLSAGRETMRKRKELGAKLIRMGSGDTPIIKRKGHTVQTFSCKAGIILTAEFPLDNLSDLTRCIIVPVDEKLKLPELLTPELMGDVVRHYSQWIAFNSEAELARLRTLLGQTRGSGGRTSYPNQL